jgi:hypothetical protein
LLPGEASRQILMRVPRRPPSVGFMAQSINQNMLGFEAQTKNHIGDFEVQITKS